MQTHSVTVVKCFNVVKVKFNCRYTLPMEVTL